MAAAAARKEGLKHYRASKREGRDDAEMTTALGFFDAACADGDDTALELRAYALAGVERFVEAAETLDVFLDAHPLTTLADDARVRVAAQQPVILARVSSLSIESPTQGAKVMINHVARGTTPVRNLRLAPGRYDIEISGEGGTATRTLDLVTGERTESFTLSAARGGPAGVAPSLDTGGTTPPASDTAGGSRLLPWAIGTGVGAVVLLGLGVGGAVWSSERTTTYDNANCATTNAAGCSSTLSQFHVARDLEVTGFVVGGLAAVGASILFYMDQRKPVTVVAPTPLGMSCLPAAGIVCVGRF